MDADLPSLVVVSLSAVFGLAAEAPLSSFLNFSAVCLVSPWVVKRSGLDGMLNLEFDSNVVGSRLVKSGSYLVFHGLFHACLARGSFDAWSNIMSSCFDSVPLCCCFSLPFLGVFYPGELVLAGSGFYKCIPPCNFP
ncbi:hypothetical protein F2Q69_00007104 [Brassica cretica]|uniref:Uncharacterized protein n=1 Tax=Brassica cretica TaxID=69181 RepID=A0A8S9P1I4_BRACR|nr:hypothetical protein F2Q69_00007104 [Brassica cretica]